MGYISLLKAWDQGLLIQQRISANFRRYHDFYTALLNGRTTEAANNISNETRNAPQNDQANIHHFC